MKLFKQISKKYAIISVFSALIIIFGAITVFAMQPKQKHVALKAAESTKSTGTSKKASAPAETETPVAVATPAPTNTETGTNQQATSVAPAAQADTAADEELANTCNGVQQLIQQYYYGPVKYYANFNALLADTNPSTANRVMPIKLHYQECVDAGKLQAIE